MQNSFTNTNEFKKETNLLQAVTAMLAVLFCIATFISIASTAQAAPLPGQIIVDPKNSSWLVYNRDSNGDGELDPAFVAGSGDPEQFLYMSHSKQDDIVRKLKDTGANSIYITVILGGDKVNGGDGNGEGQYKGEENPFVGHNPANCSNPNNCLDQGLLNRWETLFTEMDNAGIVIYLFFYDDDTSVWSGGSVGSQERNFINGIVNKFKHHKHLVWIVAEEYSEAYSRDRVRSIASAIRAADNYDHVIGVHQLSGTSFDFAGDSIIKHFAIQYNSSGFHSAMLSAWDKAAGRYSLNMSESNKHGRGSDMRRNNWAIAMGGAYVMVLDMFKNFTPTTSELKEMGHLNRFMEMTNFNKMAPNDGLRFGSTQYVLAYPGNSYIAYSSSSGNIGLKGMTAGTYTLTWFDTITGASNSQNNVTVGSGDQSWTRPSGMGNEVALFVKRGGSGGVNIAPTTIAQSIAVTKSLPENVTLTFSDPDGPTPHTVTITRQPAHGTLSGTGVNRVYTPALNYIGPDSFAFTVRDGSGATSNAATISITVKEQGNDPPVTSNQAVVTTKDTPSANISLSYNDPDGPGPFTVTITKSPANGTLAGIGNDRIYTPSSGFTGTDSFQWKVNDGLVDSSIATVTVTIGTEGPGPGPSPEPGPGSCVDNAQKIASGAYPDLAVDAAGDVHLVYARGGKLWYRKYTASSGTWTNEQDIGISQNASYRNQPRIVVDPQNRPHVMGGGGNGRGKYAYWNGSSWVQIGSFNRDTDVGVDSKGNVYVVERGGCGDTGNRSGGCVGLSKRSAGASSFQKLDDPDIANGLPRGRNDHVYTSLFINPIDDSVHIVYRHGAPQSFAYRASETAGANWFGGGVSGDDLEAPHGVADANGNIYVIGGGGTAFKRTGKPSSWQNLGRAVSGGKRRLPTLGVDLKGNLYAAVFGGKFNIYNGSSWIGEKTASSVSGQDLGHTRVAGKADASAFLVWEEGASVDAENDNSDDNFDIVFASVKSDGTLGDGSGGSCPTPTPPLPGPNEVKQGPTANFTVEIIGNTVVFTDKSVPGKNPSTGDTEPITYWGWRFGDGAILSNQFSGGTVTHTYARPDKYTARLTVIDDLGRPSYKELLIDLVNQTATEGVPSSFVTRTLLSPLKATTLPGLINVLINFLLFLATPILILLIVLSGVLYMFGGAAPSQKLAAVKVLNYALLGYILILFAKILVSVVTGVLG